MTEFTFLSKLAFTLEMVRIARCKGEGIKKVEKSFKSKVINSESFKLNYIKIEKYKVENNQN